MLLKKLGGIIPLPARGDGDGGDHLLPAGKAGQARSRALSLALSFLLYLELAGVTGRVMLA